MQKNPPPDPPGGFEIHTAAPVLRMFDEAEARAFYLDYLGFEVDWESRFSPTAPLYMQIRRGDACLHLNGHAGADDPAIQVNFSITGLAAFCEYLIAKEMDYPTPIPVDPRYKGRNPDLNLTDPSGNELVFCCQATEGDEAESGGESAA